MQTSNSYYVCNNMARVLILGLKFFHRCLNMRPILVAISLDHLQGLMSTDPHDSWQIDPSLH